MVVDIVLAQRLTCQSTTSRDIGRYRFSFYRSSFCDLKIVFRIIRSRSLREARGFAFFTRPTGSYIPRRETGYTIWDRISVGSMRLVIFQRCEKIRTWRRSVAFDLHNATPRQLFAASFSCSSPSRPIIVKSAIYREWLTHNYYINLEWYNFGEFDVESCLRKIRCKNLHISFLFFILKFL